MSDLLLVFGLLFAFLGLMMRLTALRIYGGFVSSESREARNRPLFTVESDKPHVRRIVIVTYTALVGGFAMMTAGAIAGA
jgi:hypothetical protein